LRQINVDRRFLHASYYFFYSFLFRTHEAFFLYTIITLTLGFRYPYLSNAFGVIGFLVNIFFLLYCIFVFYLLYTTVNQAAEDDEKLPWVR
jgi:hypothetical protein